MSERNEACGERREAGGVRLTAHQRHKAEKKLEAAGSPIKNLTKSPRRVRTTKYNGPPKKSQLVGATDAAAVAFC